MDLKGPSNFPLCFPSHALFRLRYNGRKRLLAVAAFVVVQEICFTIAIFLQCQPTSFFWNKRLPPPANCKHQLIIYYTDASVNIATDMLILALPWMIFSGKISMIITFC